jgi:hypothetical protein
VFTDPAFAEFLLDRMTGSAEKWFQFEEKHIASITCLGLI